MNRIRQILAVLLFVPAMMLAQSSTENYVKAETMLNAHGNNAMVSVQYYNGLGYPTVSVATTGDNGHTSYSLVTYDALGRVIMQRVAGSLCTYHVCTQKEPSLLCLRMRCRVIVMILIE